MARLLNGLCFTFSLLQSFEEKKVQKSVRVKIKDDLEIRCDYLELVFGSRWRKIRLKNWSSASEKDGGGGGRDFGGLPGGGGRESRKEELLSRFSSQKSFNNDNDEADVRQQVVDNVSKNRKKRPKPNFF